MASKPFDQQYFTNQTRIISHYSDERNMLKKMLIATFIVALSGMIPIIISRRGG